MAKIAVEQSVWDDVAPEEREKIINGLRESGLLRDGDSITPQAEIVLTGWDPIKDLCKAACDVAAGAAVAWCTANTAGTATAFCIAAAVAARDECKRRC